MKIFSSYKELSKDQYPEVLNELRNISERQGQGLRRDSFLSLTNDREDQFFLKSVQNFIVWGRVYFEAFTPGKAEQLKIEQEEMKRRFLQPLKLQVFFNEGEIDYSSAGTYPDADYFHYTLIQSPVEKAMIVERVKTPAFEGGEASPGKETSKRASGPIASKQAQLSRNELAELIDLSLDLKRS